MAVNNNQIDKSNLGFLGEDFQYRLIKAFFEDEKFFKDFERVINQNMFTEAHLRTVVGVMKEYYKQYGNPPSPEMLLIKLNERCTNVDDQQLYIETIQKIQSTTTEGCDEIESMAEKFFKQQYWIKLANEILKTAKEGTVVAQHDKMLAAVEEMNSLKRTFDDWESPMDHIDEALSPQSVVKIPTGIDELDECFGGGLDKGKVGIIIGGMGFGKTSMSTCLIANAARYKCEQNNFEGFKVLFFYFEDDKRDIWRKFISNITQVETVEINKNEQMTEFVRQVLYAKEDRELFKNNIRMCRFPSGELTPTDIGRKIKEEINRGFKPDLVIVDYFGCLAPEPSLRNEDITEKEGRMMTKLVNMAPEFGVAMWIPCQANRAGLTAEIIGNDMIGGSLKKNQIAQIVISIARSQDDMNNNVATIAVLKARNAKAGTKMVVNFNNGTSTITGNGVDFSNLGF